MARDECKNGRYGRNLPILIYPVFWNGEHGKGTTEEYKIDTILHEFGRLYGDFNDVQLEGFVLNDIAMWDLVMDQLAKYYDQRIGEDVNGIQFR